MTEQMQTAAELRTRYEATLAETTRLSQGRPGVIRQIQDEGKAKLRAYDQRLADLKAEKGEIHKRLTVAEQAEAEAAAKAVAEAPAEAPADETGAFDEPPPATPEQTTVIAAPSPSYNGRPTRRQRGN